MKGTLPYIIAVLFFFNWINLSLSQSFVVDFTADKLSGCDSLTVRFTDLTSAPELQAWMWNFGDNTFDTVQNPVHKYSSPGVYTVQLTILRNANPVPQTSSASKPNYINVRKLPSAYFTAATTQSNSTFAVAFNSKTQLDSSGFKYIWLFGDEKTDTGSSVIHTYSAEGTYKIKLYVTDNNTCTKDTTASITLKDSLVVPNVFSPNNDGINDEYFIVSNGVRDLTFQVFDRWGNLQYINTSKSIRWDGRNYAGVLLNQGTYFYILTSEGGSSNISKTGFFELNY